MSTEKVHIMVKRWIIRTKAIYFHTTDRYNDINETKRGV